MVDVGVTGAAGRVGTQALAALEDHTVRPIYFTEESDLEGVVCDIREYEQVKRASEGLDVIVHLAANPSVSASWEDARETNIDGTKHIYDAAVANEIDRVVFATTNHVTEMYNRPTPARPSGREPPRPISPDDPPRPDSYYAISKVTGEMFGSYHADVDGLEVVNIRIGWLLTIEELEEKAGRPGRDSRYARAMWLSPEDCRRAITRAVEADLPDTPVTVNITSQNSDRYLSLIEARCELGYRPQDDSARVLEEE